MMLRESLFEAPESESIYIFLINLKSQTEPIYFLLLPLPKTHWTVDNL